MVSQIEKDRMLYFIGVLVLWFLLRVYCRIVGSENKSEPYSLNKIYLGLYVAQNDQERNFANIIPVDQVSISEEEVRSVLLESKRLSHR